MVEELSQDSEGTTDTSLEAHHLTHIEFNSINIIFKMLFFPPRNGCLLLVDIDKDYGQSDNFTSFELL